MSKQTEKTFFIFSPLAVQAGLYQRLLRGAVNYQELGNRIINEIKAAHAFRRVETVYELSRILICIPVKEFKLIGQYYLVWCDFQERRYPAETLESIIEQTQTYKAKALSSRAGLEVFRGNSEGAMYFYKEAMKTSPAISDYIEMSRTIAVLKSREGFHKSALKDLENLIPIMRYAEPRLYYDLLNSYAVELNEAGRLQEAENVSSLAIASPFGPYYPEWQETYSEVNQKLNKRRSTVAISIPESKAEPETKPEPVKEPSLAKIIQFPKPKVSRYEGVETPALTPIQWLGVMLKIKFGQFIPDADDEIDRFCAVYLDLVVNFYD